MLLVFTPASKLILRAVDNHTTVGCGCHHRWHACYAVGISATWRHPLATRWQCHCAILDGAAHLLTICALTPTRLHMQIRYHLRKINADKRPRVKGRFVKKEELAAYLASIGASAPADDDAAADSPSAQQAAAPSPAGRRRGATAAARNAPDAGGSSGSGRRGGAGVGGAHKGATGAAAAAALALHAGAAGGSLSEMEQHDQMLYSMLQLHGADMDMLLESDDELEQETMEQLMVVPTVPM